MERYERENQLVGQITDLQRQLRDAQAAVEALQRERDEAIREHGKESGFWGRSCARLLDKRDELQAALDAEREKVKELHEITKVICTHCCEPMEIPSKAVLQTQLTQLQAQLADRDAMILQMGEQAAVLAKENMAVKAQLRQVEGQSQQQAEEAVIVFAKYTTLRQLVEAHAKQLTELTIIPIGCSREQELRWTQSIKDLRATLAAQDAGKHHEVD